MSNDVSTKTNPTAVLALVLGILMSPVALPLGWFAREQIRRSREKGMRLCVAAMTLGAISIPVWITGGVLFYLWWSTL
ncbi:MAG: DUF4190 domain-containing protein [Actinobacteria bacterium]|uniref:Unannotated protein n=1 Tax=freshwater metagenome TaxID=449393 RepID=A0A6J6GBL0_9ZZZZ|nr:DUF4190 domain-containing protein [Actinomycetota bacterium]